MKSTPMIYGLILNGVKSSTMTKDKGLIEYHGKPSASIRMKC